MTQKNRFTAVSLFSGMGGDCLGMRQAGCRIIAYNELQTVFCQSHDANFPQCELISDGIVRDISKLGDACFEKYKGCTDILFAGFPCQGFSHAGKKRDNDPRNSLFLQFLRATKIIRPHMIIGENVKGLLTRRTSTGQNYIEVIVEEFQKLGYNVIHSVFRTEQYGVPQKRERLVILGIRPDNAYGWRPCFPPPFPSATPGVSGIIRYDMTGAVRIQPEWFRDIPVECILTDMGDTTPYHENNTGHPYLIKKINATREECHYDGKQYDYLFSFGKRISPIHCEIIDIRKPTKTIICTYTHQPRFFVPLQNVSGCYLRVLLPSELKQIQGFPPDYIVCGTTKEQVIQIGNAVPPPLVKTVVQHILSAP